MIHVTLRIHAFADHMNPEGTNQITLEISTESVPAGRTLLLQLYGEVGVFDIHL